MQRPEEDAEGRQARPRPGMAMLARAGNLEYDRVVFFSDAIFAIAITLLVLDIPRPSGIVTLKDLHGALPAMYSFGISFVVIGMFWMGHHSLFRYITALDRTLVALNLLFLGIIAFLPYPTALLNQASVAWVATIFYAASIAAAGLAESAIWLYAMRRSDLVPGLSAGERRYLALRLLRIPVVFSLSIPIALASPRLATYSWVLVWVTGALLHRHALPRGEAGRLDI